MEKIAEYRKERRGVRQGEFSRLFLLCTHAVVGHCRCKYITLTKQIGCFDKGISSYCRGGYLHSDGPFIPICCPQLSDFIPIVLTHYIRLNHNPLIATFQFLSHILPPLGDSVPHCPCVNLIASAYQTPAMSRKKPS